MWYKLIKPVESTHNYTVLKGELYYINGGG